MNEGNENIYDDYNCLDFRINEYADSRTIFVCDPSSDYDQPRLGDGHRHVVGSFDLDEGIDISELSREDLFNLWDQAERELF